MNSVLADIRLGLRSLLRTPGVTAASLLCLILSVAANTSIFSVLNGVLWAKIPLPESDRIITVWERSLDGNRRNIGYETFLDVKKRMGSIESLALARIWNPRLTGTNEPERLSGVAVTHEFFDVTGVQPALGRAFTADDDRPGFDACIVLSHSLWKRRFGGDPDLIGATVTLNGLEHTVLGVMPEDFQPVVSRALYNSAEIWAPLAYEEGGDSACRGCRHLRMVGRLVPGETIARADAELRAIGRDLKASHPDDYVTGEFSIIGLKDFIVGDVRLAFYVLFAAVGFIMIIACANVANLLLTRSTARRREFAVRAALGATRMRLARQLFTEGILLGLIAAFGGLMLSYWGVDLLRALAPDSIPRVDLIDIDTRVLAFTAGLALVTGAVFSLAPVLDAIKLNLVPTLKQESHSSISSSRQMTRRILVVAEISLAMVLLVGAGLFVRSFAKIARIDPGFRPDNILTFSLIAPSSEFPDIDARLAFYDDVRRKLNALPGVESSALVSTLPFGGSYDTIGMVEASQGEELSANAPNADRYGVDPGYFATMGIPLLAGRVFENTDNSDAPPVIVVNRTLAQHMWPGEDPLGRQLKLAGERVPRSWIVVGVVGDVLHHGFETGPTMQVYEPHAQWPTSFVNIVIRAKANPMAQVDAIRHEIRALSHSVPVQGVRLIDELMDNSVAERRFTMSLVGGLALVAALLAAFGTYAVIAFNVNLRTREIAIRSALGAGRRDLVGLLMGEGLMLAGIGLTLGLGGAWALSRFVEGILFDTSPTDPLTYAAVGLIVLMLALVANLLPALRASDIDPLKALRCE